MAANVMVGIGETFLPAFVLALSGSQLACGLVTTIPLVAGAVLQLVSPYMVARWHSHRRWVVFCAAVQAAAFVPLAAAAVAGALPLVLVFAVVSLYWAAGLAGSGPWNAWMETLVPQQVRARYFAQRTRISQWGLSAGFVAGGVLLYGMAAGKSHLPTFAVLFVVAAASRVVSSCLLAAQHEPTPPSPSSHAAPLREMFRALAHGPHGGVLLYLLVAQGAVQIAGPYFNPYMLGHLEFSYGDYVVLICVAAVAKIVFLPGLGRRIERWGAYRVFWISAVAIAPLPAMWLVSNAFPYLVGVQVLTGLVWGANDLASLMLFFKTIPREKRVGVLTVFNLANAAATAAGSLVGGGLLAALGASRGAYLTLFALSTVARAAALLLLVRVPAGAVLRRLGTLRPDVLPVPRAGLASVNRRQYPPGPHWPRGVRPVGEESPDAHSYRSGTT
jgi:MFS family permease